MSQGTLPAILDTYGAKFSSVQELLLSVPFPQRSKPEAFVKLVLLVSMMSVFEPEKELVYLELFAGRARLTRLARSLGYPAEAHDLSFDVEAKNNLDRNNCMDLTSDAGYLLLGPGAKRKFPFLPRRCCHGIIPVTVTSGYYLLSQLRSEASHKGYFGIEIRATSCTGRLGLFFIRSSESRNSTKR